MKDEDSDDEEDDEDEDEDEDEDDVTPNLMMKGLLERNRPAKTTMYNHLLYNSLSTAGSTHRMRVVLMYMHGSVL